jgi:hypothetical protein
MKFLGKKWKIIYWKKSRSHFFSINLRPRDSFQKILVRKKRKRKRKQGRGERGERKRERDLMKYSMMACTADVMKGTDSGLSLDRRRKGNDEKMKIKLRKY